jgi:hypothetical protein
LVNTSPELIDDACAFAWVQLIRRQPDRNRNWRAWMVTVAERGAWRLHSGESRATSLTVESSDGLVPTRILLVPRRAPDLTDVALAFQRRSGGCPG